MVGTIGVYFCVLHNQYFLALSIVLGIDDEMLALAIWI